MKVFLPENIDTDAPSIERMRDRQTFHGIHAWAARSSEFQFHGDQFGAA
jgi:hypothetical protein